MVKTKRYRYPWSMNEVNRLHNEYEIKQLPILQIAKLHERGQYAILHKLSSEGLIHETWRDVRGWKNLSDIYSEANDKDYEEEKDEEEEDEEEDEEDEEDEEEDYDKYEDSIEVESLPKQKISLFQSIVTTIKLFITSALS
jgi:CO dehydrogenase/acetyl-CoA synthase beta subunit